MHRARISLHSNGRVGGRTRVTTAGMSVSLALAAITGLSFLLGFGRDVLLAREFGGSHAVDALFVALVVPVFIENIFGVALRDAVVPHLQAARRLGEAAYARAVVRLGRRTLALGLLAALALAIAPGMWVRLLAPGWNAEERTLAEGLFGQGALIVVTLVWIYFQSGVMIAENRLLIPAFRPIFFNLGAIAALVLAPGNIAAVLGGMVLGYALQLAWLQSRLGWRGIATAGARFAAPADTDGLRFASGFLPLIGASAALQVNVLAERLFASWLEEGSITLLSYAYRLATVPVVLLTLSLLTATYPTLVARHASADSARFVDLVLGALHATLALLAPAAVFLALFGEPLASLFFERGAFSAADARTTGFLVAGYAVGVPALGLALLASRALLARGEASTILRAALASMVVTVTCDAFLFRPLGALGLALAASIGAVAYAWLTWMPLSRVVGHRPVVVPILRWATSGAVVAAAGSFWPWRGPAGLAAAGAVAAALTVAGAWVLGERWRFYRGIRGH